jgi:hypothetical protein
LIVVGGWSKVVSGIILPRIVFRSIVPALDVQLRRIDSIIIERRRTGLTRRLRHHDCRRTLRISGFR